MSKLGAFLRPPGRFIVFEGADGVGKSSVLEEIVPWCATFSGSRDTYRFHWKPVWVSTGEPPGAAVDPRGKEVRPMLASLVFLCWHMLGFWRGYLTKVRPLLVRGHAVVGDRYSYDIFLDPERFRLRLPNWVCRLAALLAPRPDLVVCLTADPKTIRARKPELTVEEIESYQHRLGRLAASRSWMLEVSAEESLEATIRAVKDAVTRGVATQD